MRNFTTKFYSLQRKLEMENKKYIKFFQLKIEKTAQIIYNLESLK